MNRWRAFFVFTLLSFFWAGLAHAQEGSPVVAPPLAQWETPGAAGPFYSPDAACQAQWQYYNPNAIYQAPVFVSERVYNCAWLGKQAGIENANTILPSNVVLRCPPGWSLTESGRCYDGLEVRSPNCEQNGLCGAPQLMLGNPINIQTGGKVERSTDYASADGLMAVTRTYNSNQRGNTMASETEPAGFGEYWHGVVPGHLAVTIPGSNLVEYFSNGGGAHRFYADQANSTSYDYTAEAPSRLRLTFLSPPTEARDNWFAGPENSSNAAEVRVDHPDGEVIFYRRGPLHAAGAPLRHMIAVERRLASGYAQFFDYNPGERTPYRVRDSFGRILTLQWSPVLRGNAGPLQRVEHAAMPVISQIGLPDGTSLRYTYGVAAIGGDSFARRDRLATVRRLAADGTTVLWGRDYSYTKANFPYALTRITDHLGTVLANFDYDAAGWASMTERAGGVERYMVENRMIANGNFLRLTTNPLGLQTNYRFGNPWQFQYFNHMLPNLLVSVERQAGVGVDASTESFTYASRNDGAWLTSRTDERGVTSLFNVDLAGRPGQVTDASARPEQQVTTYAWHSTLDLPLTETRGNLRVEYTYDTQGRMTERREVDISTHTVPYSTNGQTRTWAFTWGANGKIQSVNGPRAPDSQGRDDTETYTYSPAGSLLTITNGMGHVVSYANHDANGNPGQMTDANGIVTLFIYDALGRVVSISVRQPGTGTQHATTTIEYDVEGRVIGLTRPATARLGMTYDAAGRLLTVSNSSGETITFTYDAMSNVTRRRVTSGTTQRSQIDRTFDGLGRLLTETYGIGRTASFAYDATGNPTRITSPRNLHTDQGFDGLARLVSTVLPDTGQTANSYNQNDDLVTHSDAIGVTTTMTFNGFGEVIREVSPDRGTSTYVYNGAGDLVSATDGRGQEIVYTYDILGRVLTRTPTGLAAQQVTYTYDTAAIAGSYSVGRLSQIADASGITKFKYDHRGNVLTQAQVIAGSSTFNTTFTYDLADRITRITYPSGRWVNYARDTRGRVLTVTTRASGATATTTLLSSAVYEPFGALTSATFGNTHRFAQPFDDTGRRTGRRWRASNNTTNIWSVSYAYDADDNIVGITDLVDVTRSLSFHYDPVERLSRVDMASGALRREDYVFDTNGNRVRVERRANVADATPAETDSYTRTPGTNRITTIASTAGMRSFSHDGRGNLAGESRPGGTTVSTSYDGYARLTGYTRTGEGDLAMAYNGFDQRVMLTRGSGGSAVTRRLVSDRDGRLLGEYGSAGNQLFTEYIWLLPEAADGDQIYGGDDGSGGWMPLAVATANGTAGVANETLRYIHSTHLGVPVGTYSSTGTASPLPAGTMLLGFPGQQQTLADLYYNQYRDYDPTTGRYIQADPIGLAGDANPYSYANSNPVGMVDPEGLEFYNGFPANEAITYSALFTYARLPASERRDGLHIFAHGDNRRICLARAGQNMRCLDAPQLAAWLRQHYDLDQFRFIKLWSCNTGSGENAVAARLANLVGLPVIAPNSFMWLNTTPGRSDPRSWTQRGFSGLFGRNGDGSLDANSPGNWITFSH